LDKIRTGYEKFYEFKGNRNYKYITIRTFQEMSFLDINTSRVIFKYFDKNDRKKINIYKFLIGVIWMSYATLKQKIFFLARMFSLR
jgi:hypothetical protein